MKIDAFAITFEIVTDESAEHGEADESGYYIESEQGYSLRDALAWLGLHKGCGIPHQADCSPLSISNPPRSFYYDGELNFRTGEHEYLALHIPRCVTASSRMRLARYLGYGKHWH